jgi:transcription antitermination factor NusG
LELETDLWFAIQTWPRHEKKVATELQKKKIEILLPLVASQRQWKDRQPVIQLPLFPGYIFVRLRECAEERIAVLRTYGVISFVGVRGVGVSIPQPEIDSVRILLSTGVSFQVHSFLNVGQRVRIRGGSLDGVHGILAEKYDDLSLVISIPIIQRSISIRFFGYQVEAA